MNLWHWLLLIYPWTVLGALLFLLAPTERRRLGVSALLWPVLVPWAVLSDPLGYVFSTLRWWPQQGRLIAKTESFLSPYPQHRLAQVDVRLHHAKPFGRLLLRRYYGWLADERQRLTSAESERVNP